MTKKPTFSYEIVSATQTYAAYLAVNMCQRDIDECWAAGHRTPVQAVIESYRASSNAKVGLYKGRVVCMYGVAEMSILSNVGIPWLLGTDEIEKHSNYFLRQNRYYMKEIKKKYSLLINFVDARNTVAIRWLEWLGFKVFDAQPFGPDDMPFHRFELGKATVLRTENGVRANV